MSRIVLRIISLALAIGVTALILPRLVTALHARQRIYTPENAPSRPVAIVYGAGLRRDGTPTAVLRDRVETAAELYKAGKVSKILMSGDNRFIEYNEPGAMRQYALSLGVPEHAIILDYAGRSTYETCYRAKVIFGVSRALLVTQRFHLPRALYLCHALGIESLGVSADRREYRLFSLGVWNFRELLATLNAFLDVHWLRPLPVLGETEYIDPVERQ